MDKWILADDIVINEDDPKKVAEKLQIRSDRVSYDRSRRFEFSLLWNRVDLARYDDRLSWPWQH